MKLLRRLVAVLLILLILIGLYASIKGFSGYDPLSVDQGKVSTALTTRAKHVLENWSARLTSRSFNPIATPTNRQVYLKVGLIADSHNDSENLKKALEQLKHQNVDYVLGLGDYTAVGTITELREAKKIMDASGIPYSVIPGDHDFWDNKNKGEPASKNFEQLFGEPYQGITLKNVPFILINNANNDSGLSPEQMSWLKQLLTQEKNKQDNCTQASPSAALQSCSTPVFVLLHEPLYHPTTLHIMGKLSPSVDEQRKELLVLFKQANVAEVISGDIHFFSRFSEPTQDLPMTTVGAVVNERNPQKPRYAVLTIFTDGSYDIEDKQIQ